jgi:hypothetical protein
MLTLSNAILVAGLTCCQLRSEPRIRQREPIKRTDAKLVGVVGFEPASPASRTRLWASAESVPPLEQRLSLPYRCPSPRILGLRWEWIDFERGIIFLPDSKTGKKSIVLSAEALAVLSKVTRTAAT